MFRIGIIGADWWATQVHAPAFEAAGAVIAGVHSRSAQAAHELAPQHGAQSLDLVELLATSDAIAISTPDDTHARYAIAAVQAGRHVCVEKPLGRSVPEAREIADAARSAGVIGMTGLTARGDPITDRPRDLTTEGALGTVTSVRGFFDLDLFADPSAETTWRLREEASGWGGVIADLGPHLFDLAEYVTGVPIEIISATGGIRIPRAEPVTNLDEAAVLATIGEASAMFSMSRIHLGRSCFRLEVQGTAGALVLDWGIWQPGEGLLFGRRPDSPALAAADRSRPGPVQLRTAPVRRIGASLRGCGRKRPSGQPLARGRSTGPASRQSSDPQRPRSERRQRRHPPHLTDGALPLGAITGSAPLIGWPLSRGREAFGAALKPPR